MNKLFGKKWVTALIMAAELVIAGSVVGGTVFFTGTQHRVTAAETENTAAVSALAGETASAAGTEIMLLQTEYAADTETEAETEIETECAEFAVKTHFTLSSHTVELTGEGSTYELSGKLLEQTIVTDPEGISWSSSDETVAVVDQNGSVTAVGKGSCVITAGYLNYTASCHITVKIPVTSIAFGMTDISNLRLGDSVQIPLFYFPEYASEIEEAEWTSSNEAAVTVDQSGTVTAVGPGTAVITAKSGELTASVNVTAIVPVTGVAISQTGAAVNKGECFQLAASCAPGNTTENPYIYWSSDNISVATVDGNGVVNAVGPGTCNIVASHDDVSASCFVTVYSPMAGIQIDQGALNLTESFDGTLTVSFLPEDTTGDRTVSWATSDPAVATVDGAGNVHAVSAGTCTVTACCSGFTAQAAVQVTPYIAVESIAVSESAITFGESGEMHQLSASVAPADASCAVSWSSSDPAVAVVSGDGLVTARGSGDCVITAAAGDKTASCSVHVTASNVVVVLDPGHNKSYTGAYYNGVMEDDINLKVAQYCKAYLENNYAGVTVIMTRYDGSALGSTLGQDLYNRAKVAQDNGASVLVSFHFNASNSHAGTGCLTFISNNPTVYSQSVALSNEILSRISALGLANQGAIVPSNRYIDANGNSMDYYAINRHSANMGIPGIIVEHCFMDHDYGFINEASFAAFGQADAEGIAAYLGLSRK